MRIRADGIYNGVPGWRYRALLNGEFVAACIEADDAAGYVIVANHEPGDRPGTMRFTGGETRIEGLVTIEPPPEPA